jgi:hypothetical protein
LATSADACQADVITAPLIGLFFSIVSNGILFFVSSHPSVAITSVHLPKSAAKLKTGRWHLTNVNHFTRPVCLNFN